MRATTSVGYAWRRLSSAPLLSFGAVVILAAGIGSAVVMLDVVDRLLLRAPAHVADPDRVARLFVSPRPGVYGGITGYASLEALQSVPDELALSAAFFGEALSLGQGPGARRLHTVAHSGGYFDVLGLHPALGAWPAAAAEDAAVISHRLWHQDFAGSPDVLGQPLRLGMDTYRIAAVSPSGFAGIGHEAVDVWLPLEPRARATYGADWKTSSMFLEVIARLRPGASREQAENRATAAWRARHEQPWEKDSTVVLGDLRPARAPGARVGARVETLAAALAIMVLLITCGNAANLLLVRGLRRERELMMKTALGASRGRLFREIMAEAALLAAGAGLLAFAVVALGTALMRREFLSPAAALGPRLDTRLIAATVLFCATAAFLLGTFPALNLTARRALRPGAAAGVRRSSRLIDVFSGLQVSLSVPLLTAALLFGLSLWKARSQDFGMTTQRVAVVTSNLLEVGRPWDGHTAHREIQARLARLPQVETSALVQHLPMKDGTFFNLEIPGKPPASGALSTDTLPLFNAVDPSFFAVMGMRLLEGRLFTDAENRAGAAPVAVITRSMAAWAWPGQSAVGKCFYMGDRSEGCTRVIGVLADARLMPSIRPTTQWSSACYLPLEQKPRLGSSRALLVRTAGPLDKALELLRNEAQAAMPELPYVSVHAFDDVFRSMVRPWRLGTIVFALFSALALAIAAFGLAVVTAHAVTRRTHEIGIRSALGAAPGRLVRLVLVHSLAVVILGLLAGAGLTWAAAPALGTQLFEVSSRDMRALGTSALLLMLVGALAAWMPARRAARINPIAALRSE